MEQIQKCKCGGVIGYQQNFVEDCYEKICTSCNSDFGRFSEEELRAICWRDFYKKEVVHDSV